LLIGLISKLLLPCFLKEYVQLLHELIDHFYDYKITTPTDIYRELNITHYES